MKNQKKLDQEIIEEIRTYTGLPLGDIVSVFEAFSFYVLGSYSENERIRVPNFGEFFIKFDGDEVTPLGREAKVTGFFTPSDCLKKMIGQYEDAKRTGEYYNIDLIKRMKQRSKDALEHRIEE